MSGGDQGGAVVGTGDVARLAAAFERDFQHRQVIGDRGDGYDVVFLCLKRIGVGAEPHQGTRGLRLLHKSRHMQWRAGAAVARVERRT